MRSDNRQSGRRPVFEWLAGFGCNLAVSVGCTLAGGRCSSSRPDAFHIPPSSCCLALPPASRIWRKQAAVRGCVYAENQGRLRAGSIPRQAAGNGRGNDSSSPSRSGSCIPYCITSACPFLLLRPNPVVLGPAAGGHEGRFIMIMGDAWDFAVRQPCRLPYELPTYLLPQLLALFCSGQLDYLP